MISKRHLCREVRPDIRSVTQSWTLSLRILVVANRCNIFFLSRNSFWSETRLFLMGTSDVIQIMITVQQFHISMKMDIGSPFVAECVTVSRWFSLTYNHRSRGIHSYLSLLNLDTQLSVLSPNEKNKRMHYAPSWNQHWKFISLHAASYWNEKHYRSGQFFGGK